MTEQAPAEYVSFAGEPRRGGAEPEAAGASEELRYAPSLAGVIDALTHEVAVDLADKLVKVLAARDGISPEQLEAKELAAVARGRRDQFARDAGALCESCRTVGGPIVLHPEGHWYHATRGVPCEAQTILKAWAREFGSVVFIIQPAGGWPGRREPARRPEPSTAAAPPPPPKPAAPGKAPAGSLAQYILDFLPNPCDGCVGPACPSPICQEIYEARRFIEAASR